MTKSRKAAKNRQMHEGRKLSEKSYKLAERQPCPTPHKQHYPGRKEAKAALKRFRGVGKETRDLHAYRCQCGRWHLGAIPHGLAQGIIDRGIVNAHRPVP